VIAYPELGPEAVRRLEVKDFPVMVLIDHEGNNLYELGKAEYRRI
ncbi:fumarate hydratase C-terminal domain-containing protein, partial [Desulfitobacterium sp.]